MMMGSLEDEGLLKKKAMWLYPKVLGSNPSERWGHSACCSNGVVYVYGGCCGGLHFSDVLMFNLEKMAWNTVATTGQRPGTRDSHSAVLVGHRMMVMGGTNGSKKVNDLHILDLRTKEWSSPDCVGSPPSPRESHTATVVGEDKLVIFGGSGEGEANYLNDVHILDLKTKRWTSPRVKGDRPAPRDSHTAVAVGNKLLVYGGDCGDRYHGEVDMLDMDTLTWSRLPIHGSSPGVRAGHSTVNIGTKVYVIGGVGDKHYYNDVWVLDLCTCSWTELDIRGQQPQGRFSHTAVVTDSDIAIYGGCGEDERPLNELLILQLGAEHPNGRYNISLCKIFGNHWNQEKRRLPREIEKHSKTMVLGNNVGLKQGACELESEPKQSLPDNLHPKRKRISESKGWETESEQEEHSLSLSQHSSPSQSDQEPTPVKKLLSSATDFVKAPNPFPLFKQRNQIPSNVQSDNAASSQQYHRSNMQRNSQDLHFMGENPRQPKPEQFLHVAHLGRQEAQYPAEAGPIHNLIGAEIQGKVDGAFDSGYLMTANINGKILRGVLFALGPAVVSRMSASPQIAVSQPYPNTNYVGPSIVRPSQQSTMVMPESVHHFRRAQPVHPSTVSRASPALSREPRLRSDLQGVVLTLGGPGSGHGAL